MTALRGGTVTFVFTDIEGSTKLLERLGEGYAGALAEHRRLIREAFAARGGQEIDTQGDAFFYCFRAGARRRRRGRRRPARARRHEWPDGSALRVRMSSTPGSRSSGRRGTSGSTSTARRGSVRRPRRAGAALRDDGRPRLGGDAGRGLEARSRRGAPQGHGGAQGRHPAPDRRPPQSFLPLRVEEEEPMDFGERLARRSRRTSSGRSRPA